jgi:hypothetical protein
MKGNHMNTVSESPVLLSGILGAGSVGDLMVQVCEFGAAGDYPLGSVMAADGDGKVVMASDGSDVFGILVEERIILDLAAERMPSAKVARNGSFRADQLHVAEGSSLASMVPRLRELGIFVEGLAFAEARAESEETEETEETQETTANASKTPPKPA